jgi:hypothetical protein
MELFWCIWLFEDRGGAQGLYLICDNPTTSCNYMHSATNGRLEECFSSQICVLSWGLGTWVKGTNWINCKEMCNLSSGENYKLSLCWKVIFRLARWS